MTYEVYAGDGKSRSLVLSTTNWEIAVECFLQELQESPVAYFERLEAAA